MTIHIPQIRQAFSSQSVVSARTAIRFGEKGQAVPSPAASQGQGLASLLAADSASGAPPEYTVMQAIGRLATGLDPEKPAVQVTSVPSASRFPNLFHIDGPLPPDDDIRHLSERQINPNPAHPANMLLNALARVGIQANSHGIGQYIQAKTQFDIAGEQEVGTLTRAVLSSAKLEGFGCLYRLDTPSLTITTILGPRKIKAIFIAKANSAGGAKQPYARLIDWHGQKDSAGMEESLARFVNGFNRLLANAATDGNLIEEPNCWLRNTPRETSIPPALLKLEQPWPLDFSLPPEELPRAKMPSNRLVDCEFELAVLKIIQQAKTEQKRITAADIVTVLQSDHSSIVNNIMQGRTPADHGLKILREKIYPIIERVLVEELRAESTRIATGKKGSPKSYVLTLDQVRQLAQIINRKEQELSQLKQAEGEEEE